MRVNETQEAISIEVETGETLIFIADSMKTFLAPYTDKNNLTQLIETLNFQEEANKKIYSEINNSETHTKAHLNRLTVIVSQNCNLACLYCYAAHGSYGLPTDIQGNNTGLLNSLAYILSEFDVDNVMFFGGEPSQGLDVIIDCCLMIQSLVKQGILTSSPHLGVVSNLYGQASQIDYFLSICKRFNIGITASIDGPACVHNKNRPTPNGRGSHETVHKNIRLAKQIGLQIGIECTLTKNHVEQGISVVDLMRYFYDEFGLTETHIVPVTCVDSNLPNLALTSKETSELFCAGIEYMVKTLGKPDYFQFMIGWRLIDALTRRTPVELYCTAGYGDLTIGYDGSVYPCFMFVGDSAFNLGSPIDNENFRTALTSMATDFLPLQRKQHGQCATCWARNLCFGCVGTDYIVAGDVRKRTRCDFIKTLACEAIVRITEHVEGRPLGQFGNEHRKYFSCIRRGGSSYECDINESESVADVKYKENF